MITLWWAKAVATTNAVGHKPRRRDHWNTECGMYMGNPYQGRRNWWPAGPNDRPCRTCFPVDAVIHHGLKQWLQLQEESRCGSLK